MPSAPQLQKQPAKLADNGVNQQSWLAPELLQGRDEPRPVRTVRTRVVLELLSCAELREHRSDSRRVVKDLSSAADGLDVSRFVTQVATHHERMIRPGIWIVTIIRDIHGKRPVQTGTVVELVDFHSHLDREQTIGIHLAALDCDLTVVEDRLDQFRARRHLGRL